MKITTSKSSIGKKYSGKKSTLVTIPAFSSYYTCTVLSSPQKIVDLAQPWRRLQALPPSTTSSQLHIITGPILKSTRALEMGFVWFENLQN